MLKIRISREILNLLGEVMILKKCKQKKWLIKLTVAAVMCVSILISTCAMTSCTGPIVEGAEYESEDFKYTYWEFYGGIVINKYIGTEANVVIPEKIGKHPVTRIGPRAFKEQRGIKNITIPNTVTVIDDDAFAWWRLEIHSKYIKDNWCSNNCS